MESSIFRERDNRCWKATISVWIAEDFLSSDKEHSSSSSGEPWCATGERKFEAKYLTTLIHICRKFSTSKQLPMCVIMARRRADAENRNNLEPNQRLNASATDVRWGQGSSTWEVFEDKWLGNNQVPRERVLQQQMRNGWKLLIVDAKESLQRSIRVMRALISSILALTKRFVIALQHRTTWPHRTRLPGNASKRWVRHHVSIMSHFWKIQDYRYRWQRKTVRNPGNISIHWMYVDSLSLKAKRDQWSCDRRRNFYNDVRLASWKLRMVHEKRECPRQWRVRK